MAERKPDVVAFRCYYAFCGKLLTKEMKEKGGCPCGSTKYRAIPITRSSLSSKERRMLKKGKIHVLDLRAPSIDPDVLNFDNEGYWDRVAQTAGREIAERRRALAEKERAIYDVVAIEESVQKGIKEWLKKNVKGF